MSERQVQRMVRDLVASEELYADPHTGRGHTTRYVVRVGLTPDELNSILQTWLKKDDKMSSFTKDDMLSPFAEQKGDISDTKGDTAMSPDPLKIRSRKEGRIRITHQQ